MNFLKKVFSPIFFLLAVSLLVYTFYKSEIYSQGLDSYKYLIYYIISLLLVVLSIITFFINEKIKKYFIISLISVVFFLYISEGYLLLKMQKKHLYSTNLAEDITKKAQLYREKTGKKYDTRSRLQIYEDLKRTNNNIAIESHPNTNPINNKYKIFPLSGISSSKTILCEENGYYAIYESDRFGFNNPNYEWDVNEIEYLLVGDSFTHGSCVNRPNDIASVLRNLSNKSVLNLGYSSNGPLVEYATLREYLRPNVKKVLWIYYGNDLNDLQFEKSNNFLINYFNDLGFTQNLKTKQNNINNLLNTIIEKEQNNMKMINEIKNNKIEYNKFISFIKISSLRKLIFSTIKPSDFKKVLKLAKDLTIENNSELYLVYLPEFDHQKKKFNLHDYVFVKKVANELKIPFIDIYKQVFEKEANPLIYFPFSLDGHYNVEGYSEVAKSIYQYTKNFTY